MVVRSGRSPGWGFRNGPCSRCEYLDKNKFLEPLKVYLEYRRYLVLKASAVSLITRFRGCTQYKPFAPMSGENTNRTPSGPISGLRNVTTFLTGTSPSDGKAIVLDARLGEWKAYDKQLQAFNIAYTTSEFPVSLNDNVDVEKHDALMSDGKLGLVNKGGTVCRIVDFAPGFDCAMHRTKSLDYGVVLEGTLDLVLDSGERHRMQRGDVAVQRATMHAWQNTSQTEWARMLFVLQDCQPLLLNGELMKEDLGRGIEGLPPSGNDV